MENNHLTYFKVENFKKFESLEVNDIGQFNLIVGDNNVGKTCLLEALLFDDNYLKMIANYHQTLFLRGINFLPKKVNVKDIEFPKESYFSYISKDVLKPITIKYNNLKRNTLSIEYKSFNELNKKDLALRKDNYQYENLEHWLKFYKDSVFEELQFMYLDNLEPIDEYWPYLQFNIAYSNDIADYLRILNKNRNEDDQKINELSYNHKIELIKILNKIFNLKIIDYKTKYQGDNIMVSIATEDNHNYVAITQWGDGFNKIFRYIVEIMYVKEAGNDRIMIDEIDTGIHYSKLKKLWINIISISKELNVQIFTTTHSQECINSFFEASKELNEKDIRLIRLQENRDKSIKAICYKEDYIEYVVESNTEER